MLLLTRLYGLLSTLNALQVSGSLKVKAFLDMLMLNIPEVIEHFRVFKY